MAAVAVGIVGKPLGLRGEVYVQPDPDLAVAFPVGSRYAADDRTLTVAGSRLHGNRRVVHFDGVDSREAAESLRGRVLTVDRDELVLAEDAFWADEIVGREVVTSEGLHVGTVAGVADGTAHDYLVVAREGGRDVLVPAVDELVEVTGERVVVQALAGLLDDADET